MISCKIISTIVKGVSILKIYKQINDKDKLCHSYKDKEDRIYDMIKVLTDIDHVKVYKNGKLLYDIDKSI